MKANNYKLYLASKSPRRKYLLEEADIEFEHLDINISEDYPESLDQNQVAEYLAIKKGKGAQELLDSNEICITADTIVILNHNILEKPSSNVEAAQMLKSLSNQKHVVITGVCFSTNANQVSFSVHSNVFFGPLSDQEIDYYIERYKPFDKAGAYGIQEWLGWCKIKEIQGSYSNIMGLPMYELYHEYNKFIQALNAS